MVSEKVIFRLIFAAVLNVTFIACRQLAVQLSSQDPGTIKFGFLFPGHDTANNPQGPAGSPLNCCGPVIVSQSLLVAQFRRIIFDINNAQPPILPAGVRLGYEVLDTCASPNFASAQLIKWLNDRASTTSSPISVVIGTSYSRISQTVAPFFEQFGIPMVDYGATSPALSDKNAFPLIARTTASDKYLARAMVKTIEHLGWPCVHLLHSRGQYGEKGAEEVAQLLFNSSICIANGGAKSLPINESETEIFTSVVNNFSRKTRVVICFCEDTTLKGLLRALIDVQKRDATKYFILAGDFWGTEMDLSNLETVATGSFTFKTIAQAGRQLSGRIGANNAALQEWIKQTLHDTSTEFDPWLNECLIERKGCTLTPIKDEPLLPHCNSTEFKETDLPTPDWLALLSNAIYAAAYGLRSFLDEKCRLNANDANCNRYDIRKDGYRFYEHILNASFPLENGQNFTFYNKREGHPFIEINRLKREHHSGKFASVYEKVGTWDSTSGLTIAVKDLSLHQPTTAEMTGSCSANDVCSVRMVPDIFIRPDYVITSNRGLVCVSSDSSGSGTKPATSEASEMTKHKVALPIISALLAVVVLALVVLAFSWYCKLGTSHQEQSFVESILQDKKCGFSEEEQSEYGKLLKSNLISNSQLQIDTNQLLGQGIAGIVYKGTFNGEAMAVKTLRNNTVEPQVLAQVIKEAAVMLNFNHPNVLKLLGINVSNNSLNIVFPFISGGNLKDFLRENGPRLSQDDRIFYCLQICSAMEYISSQKCIHRDLACRNILVEKLPYMMLLKIADFGNSRQLAEDDYYPLDADMNRGEEKPKPRKVPVRWYPREALAYEPRPIFEVRSDVWSFGCVCVEIFSNGEKPYANMTNNQVLYHVIHQQGFPDMPPLCSRRFYYDVMLPCWRPERSERPTFSQVLQRLERFKTNMDEGQSIYVSPSVDV